MSPAIWSESLSDMPVLDRCVDGVVPGLVRRWQHIEPEIEQVALDQHFVSIHLGGNKRLSRRGEGPARVCDVPSGAFSVVPAGAAFHWNTQGPIDFAHIYFAPAILDYVIADVFDRDPSRITLREGLGAEDPLIGSLALSLLEELGGEDINRAYLDDLMHLLLCRLLRLNSNVGNAVDRACHSLAPFRLRNAIAFIEEHLAEPIGVAEIAAASGVSPYHFSRAFRQTTGRPPYAYLLDRRIAKAKQLLAETGTPLTTIARLCGFTSLSQFSRMLRRETGMTPTRFRDQF